MLDFVYKALDKMALFVPMFIIFTLLLSVGSWWNDRLGFFTGVNARALAEELVNL